MVLGIRQKGGFYTHDIDVRIYDKRGKLFLSKQNPKREYFFNLPAGQFFTENTIFHLRAPLNFTLPKLPKFEKSHDFDPTDVKIHYDTNVGLGAISVPSRNIYFDPSLFQRPMPEYMYVSLHELGHNFYNTEKYCDLFAERIMLILGYNPSQITRGNFRTLCKHYSKPRNFESVRRMKQIKTC